MIIFKPPEVQKVLSGEKIETRRHGIKRWTVGSVHVARTNFRDEGVFAKIRITGESYQQELRMMREEDALREGNYTINDRCKEKFIDKIFARMACKVCVQRSTCFQYAWLKMNGVWKPDEKLWVVRFQKVDEKELETKNELKKEEFIERSENILSMADASRKLNIKVEKIKWLVKIGKIEVFRNDKSKTYIDISKINMDVFTNRKFVTIRRIEKLGYTKESIIGAILQGKVEFKQSKKGTWLININSADLSLFEKKLEIEKKELEEKYKNEFKDLMEKEKLIENHKKKFPFGDCVLRISDAARHFNVSYEKVKHAVDCGRIKVFDKVGNRAYIDISKINPKVFEKKKFVTIDFIVKTLRVSRESVLRAIEENKINYRKTKTSYSVEYTTNASIFDSDKYPDEKKTLFRADIKKRETDRLDRIDRMKKNAGKYVCPSRIPYPKNI